MGPTGSAGPPVGRALAIELRREHGVATMVADVKSGYLSAEQAILCGYHISPLRCSTWHPQSLKNWD